jgi:polyisoprenoid-binding protein YceI
MKYKLVLFFSLFTFFANAQNNDWVVNTSSIKFKIKNAGFTVDGAFSELSAKINFDQSKTIGNAIEATVLTKTVNTGNGKRDNHLQQEEYFDVAKYPIISIKSATILKEKDGTFKGSFKVTIKNKSKDIIIPFSFIQNENKGTIKGSFTINRLDFGVGESSMILSDMAAIEIELNVSKK